MNIYTHSFLIDQCLWVGWNVTHLHLEISMTDTIGEQPFGRYREVVFVERFQFPTNMLNESIPATNESWSFANYFSSFYLIQVLKRL